MVEPLHDALVVAAGPLGALVGPHALVPAQRHLQDPGESALARRVEVEDGVRPGGLAARVRVPGYFMNRPTEKKRGGSSDFKVLGYQQEVGLTGFDRKM